jgi:hypothetical protein
MAARKKRRPAPVEFDLTPMIDVTFQLLIFFIIAMKFKQIERRHGADLPLDEGPNPTPAEPVDRITLRMKWENNAMYYAVDVGKANSLLRGDNLMTGGTLGDMMRDRVTDGNPHYTNIHRQIVDRLRAASVEAANATKIEVAMASDTKASSDLQIDKTAPWGFVTLAVDACSSLNQERKAAGKDPYSVTFKNTEPGSGTRLN